VPGIAGVWDWLQRPDQLCRTAGVSGRVYLVGGCVWGGHDAGRGRSGVLERRTSGLAVWLDLAGGIRLQRCANGYRGRGAVCEHPSC